MDLKNTPVALPPLLSRCPSSVLDPIRCTHPGALIVRRGIRRTSAVFSGLRKACLGTAVNCCSSIASQSSNIPRRSSRSPLRLLRQRRELKLASDGSFRLFCTDCPLRAELYKPAFSSSIRANSRPVTSQTLDNVCAAMRSLASHPLFYYISFLWPLVYEPFVHPARASICVDGCTVPWLFSLRCCHRQLYRIISFRLVLIIFLISGLADEDYGRGLRTRIDEHLGLGATDD